MILGYDDAAYFIDSARESCVIGDFAAASDATAAALTALENAPRRGGDATAYARAAGAALSERPPDVERAETYLGLSARAVEEQAALARAGAYSVG